MPYGTLQGLKRSSTSMQATKSMQPYTGLGPALIAPGSHQETALTSVQWKLQTQTHEKRWSSGEQPKSCAG